MAKYDEILDQLIKKLENLSRKQDEFSQEINHLRLEIYRLKTAGWEEKPSTAGVPEEPASLAAESYKPSKEEPSESAEVTHEELLTEATNEKKIATSGRKSSLEKFIGENLSNKIGIVITIIGVAIGARYTIEQELVTPLIRIVLGYVSGILLLGVGWRLKKKYENFSAVLVSGAMAILYFITFFAYSFYALVSQVPAFALMVIFTFFTVLAAISWSRPVIAHIGLVGAYAVPFLLGGDSENMAILFSYVAIINVGILILSVKKYWKSLYYSSFGITWLIYFLWYLVSYQMDEHFRLALAFLGVFFVTFYLTFLIYKLLQNEKFALHDVFLLLANSFVFYGIGFLILNKYASGRDVVGLFTLANAFVHLLVSAVVYQQKLADRNLFYLVSGLGLVFITITIPVKLDGNWVTLLWAGEAALLFWIGRTKNASFYEKLAYPLVVVAFLSLLHDWMSGYYSYLPEWPETRITPLLNIYFLTSVLFVLAMGFISYTDRKYQASRVPKQSHYNLSTILISVILLVALYFSFFMEISTYWNHLYSDSLLKVSGEGLELATNKGNEDLRSFKILWLLNYSMAFFSLLSWGNIKKIRNTVSGSLNFIINVLLVFIFLTSGLSHLGELRESYMQQALAEYYHKGIFHLGIRYVSFVFVALVLWTSYAYTRQDFMGKGFRKVFDFLLHISVLWIASSELIYWLKLAEIPQAHQLVLSILWGVYALLLIVLGIREKKQHLRIAAMVLFGATLMKLFFYDISDMDTIGKTIVLIALGILLLIISFLYNKYKHAIADKEPENESGLPV